MDLDLEEGGVSWVVNRVMLVVHQVVAKHQADMDELKGQRATMQTNIQSQSLKVSECKKILEKAIIKQSKERERLEAHGFVGDEIQTIVVPFRAEMLDLVPLGELNFLIATKLWLPHAINFWEVVEIGYQQVEASIQQAHDLVKKSWSLTMEEREYISLWFKVHSLNNLILTPSKRLDDVAKHHMKMLTYFKDNNHRQVMASYSNPTKHFPKHTLEPQSLPITLCLICGCFFQDLDIIVLSCLCMHHCWCI
jgi:hypothetical protein